MLEQAGFLSALGKADGEETLEVFAIVHLHTVADLRSRGDRLQVARNILLDFLSGLPDLILIRLVDSLRQHEDGGQEVDRGDDGAQNKEPAPATGLDEETSDHGSNLGPTRQESGVDGHCTGIVAFEEEVYGDC